MSVLDCATKEEAFKFQSRSLYKQSSSCNYSERRVYGFIQAIY
jgi:hypothetical protein